MRSSSSSLLCFLLTYNLFIGGKALVASPATATEVTPTALKNVATKVAVCGATGRTGRLVVKELLKREVTEVVAIVRDNTKAEEVFPEADRPSNLVIVKCNLGDEDEITSSIDGIEAAIWCATGFSDAPGTSTWQKVKRLFGIALAPARSIDAVGVPCLANYLKDKPKTSEVPLPRIVMLSSAGVTRPSWDDKKKELFKGAADIPIVRLNPFGILDVKRESEERLRQSGADYCIVRPCGLNDEWPAGSRPVFSQGDVAVGRINREDVASILVDVLTTPEATGKTFEAIALAGYPQAGSIGAALDRLLPDKDGLPSENVIAATYSAMQQLLPGETQDASQLAMGQSYEELDEGKPGRLGKRGEENAEAAAPKPSS